MKTIIKLSIVACVTIAFSSCQPNNSNNPNNGTPPVDKDIDVPMVVC